MVKGPGGRGRGQREVGVVREVHMLNGGGVVYRERVWAMEARVCLKSGPEEIPSLPFIGIDAFYVMVN